MRRFLLPLVVVFLSLLFLAGCGKRMTGVFESEPSPIPAMPDFGVKSPQMDALRAQNAKAMSQVQQMTKMRIEFDGSKVRFTYVGMGTTIEYPYKAYDDHVDVQMDTAGIHIIQAITLNSDGSLTYLDTRYTRVR
jgi:hypothetical protein